MLVLTSAAQDLRLWVESQGGNTPIFLWSGLTACARPWTCDWITDKMKRSESISPVDAGLGIGSTLGLLVMIPCVCPCGAGVLPQFSVSVSQVACIKLKDCVWCFTGALSAVDVNPRLKVSFCSTETAREKSRIISKSSLNFSWCKCYFVCVFNTLWMINISSFDYFFF